jgi:hypothetical protein
MYQPNFNDSRIKDTATRALNFVELYTKSNRVDWISYKELFKHFGNTNRPLGRWLKETLLVTRDPAWNSAQGQCKKYSANPQGIQLVKEKLGLVDFTPSISKELEQQIITGDFLYEEKSDRLYNPVQYIPKRHRNKILANHGYRYHYDIEAAAPTMLLQRAQKLNPTLALPNLEYYSKNRSEIRNKIARECEITATDVKQVISSILQGGVLSTWKENKTFMELNYNRDAIIRLNNNPTVIGLKDDIREMWKNLRGEFPVRYLTDKNGKKRKSKITPKEKSGYYRHLEKEVGDVIRKMLKKHKVTYLWIHDGWCCDKVIDPALLVSQVRRLTGLVVELDWAIYEE